MEDMATLVLDILDLDMLVLDILDLDMLVLDTELILDTPILPMELMPDGPLSMENKS